MASLLMRLYDANDGVIMVDGIDIKLYPVAELRKKIGIVM